MSPWWLKPAQDEHQRPPGPGIAKADPNDPLTFILIAFSLAGFLSMMATAFLSARYPIPDDDAITIGLVGFFLVVFFDLALIYRFVRPEFREGQRIAATKMLATFIVLGLLVAPLVGVLPWLFRWLINYSPWVSRTCRALFVLGLLSQWVWLWRRWRVRKSTRP